MKSPFSSHSRSTTQTNTQFQTVSVVGNTNSDDKSYVHYNIGMTHLLHRLQATRPTGVGSSHNRQSREKLSLLGSPCQFAKHTNIKSWHDKVERVQVKQS